MQIVNLASLLESLKKIHERYSNSIHIPITITDLNGNPISKTIMPNKFYLKVIRKSKILNYQWRKILHETARRKRIGKDKFLIMELYENISIFSIPYMRNNKVVGYIIGGPIRTKNPNILECEKQSKKFGISFEDYLESVLTLTFLRNSRLDAAAKILTTIAQTLLMEPGTEQDATIGRDKNHIPYEAAM